MTAVRCGNTSDDGGIVACGDAISFNKMISKGMNGEFLKRIILRLPTWKKSKGKSLPHSMVTKSFTPCSILHGWNAAISKNISKPTSH